jgi:hypothetical protein
MFVRLSVRPLVRIREPLGDFDKISYESYAIRGHPKFVLNY